MSALGRRINQLRLAKGDSLQDLANAVGVSKAHIWELEKGRTDNPAMALVTRLADHFDVTVSYLVGEEIEGSNENPNLQRMFRQARALDERDRETLDALLQSFLRRKEPG
ncbi:MAG: helix-turn-helix domain-containing protein [Paracoccaceae bacterium]|nr:helix-turn-helix domain-containing protein [Paracoccaceae bacterium]